MLFISVFLSSYELFNIMHRRAFSQNAKLSSRVRFQCTHYDFSVGFDGRTAAAVYHSDIRARIDTRLTADPWK